MPHIIGFYLGFSVTFALGAAVTRHKTRRAAGLFYDLGGELFEAIGLGRFRPVSAAEWAAAGGRFSDRSRRRVGRGGAGGFPTGLGGGVGRGGAGGLPPIGRLLGGAMGSGSISIAFITPVDGFGVGGDRFWLPPLFQHDFFRGLRFITC